MLLAAALALGLGPWTAENRPRQPFKMMLLASPAGNLTTPTFVEYLPSGNLLVSDSDERMVQHLVEPLEKTASSERFITEGALSYPAGLARSADGKSLYLAEQHQKGVRKLALDGTIEAQCCRRTDPPPLLESGLGLAVGRVTEPSGADAGAVFVADVTQHRILALHPETLESLAVIAPPAEVLAGLRKPFAPHDLAHRDHQLYVADSDNGAVFVFSTDLGLGCPLIRTLGAGREAARQGGKLNKPRGVAVGMTGVVYVAELRRIHVLSEEGDELREPFEVPGAVALLGLRWRPGRYGATQMLYAADPQAKRVFAIEVHGTSPTHRDAPRKHFYRDTGEKPRVELR